MQSPFHPAIPMERDKDLYNVYLDNILNRAGHNLSDSQCTAKLGRDALALQNLLHQAPHDIDNIRAHIITTVETLLLTVNNTGVTKTYSPCILIAHLNEDPQNLNITMSNLIQQILHLMTDRQPGTRIDNLANMLEKLDCFIEAALKTGQFKNFDQYVILALEYHQFWPILNVQRQEYINNFIDYKYQLEMKSIFPLKYELENDRSNPVARLVRVHGFQDKSTKRMELVELSSQLMAMAKTKAIAGYQPQSEGQQTVIMAISKACGWPDRKINIHNDHTFLPLIISKIKPPTFSEAWALTLPSYELPTLLPADTRPTTHVTLQPPRPVGGPLTRTTPKSRAVPVIQNKGQAVPVIRPTSLIPPSTPATGVSAVYCETPDCYPLTPVKARELTKSSTRKKLFDISNIPHDNIPAQQNCTEHHWQPPQYTTVLPQFQPEPAQNNTENHVTWNLSFDEHGVLQEFIGPPEAQQEFIGLPGVHYSPISPAGF